MPQKWGYDGADRPTPKLKEKGAATEEANPFFSLRSYGAEGQNRTADTGIFSRIFRNSEIPVFSTS